MLESFIGPIENLIEKACVMKSFKFICFTSKTLSEGQLEDVTVLIKIVKNIL